MPVKVTNEWKFNEIKRKKKDLRPKYKHNNNLLSIKV